MTMVFRLFSLECALDHPKCDLGQSALGEIRESYRNFLSGSAYERE